MTSPLPLPAGRIFLTDGGLETTLIFHDGVDLPHFAAIDLLRRPGGRDRLKGYFEGYLAIARESGAGFILEAATWRAGTDWAEPLGLSLPELDALNREAVAMLVRLRDAQAREALPILVSGCVGPRGDGYAPGRLMTAGEAEAYHGRQIAALAEGGAEMITAMTMTNVPEAIGIVRAATARGLPAVISFTLETDGRLPTGNALAEAIAAVDAAATPAPAYYMLNCAHPAHFEAVLDEGGAWVSRIGGLRANASRRSHAELDAAPDLDCGDPDELAAAYRRLAARHPALQVFGGCCGTDGRHVAAIARAVSPALAA